MKSSRQLKSLALPLLSVSALLASPLAAQQGSSLYEVTFEATWSPATHPGAFPSGAHFSPLVGGTHNSGVSFWTPGGLASPGIESMAETGSTSSLIAEVNAAITGGTAGAVVTGGSTASSPETVVTTFTVTDEFPLISLTTMIAPSPDWFVGVHGVDLFVNQQWVDDLVVPLLAYDSGTDSGVNFTSGNQDTQPQDPIALQTGGPFTGTVPLGTFTFRRLSSTLSYGTGVNPSGSIAFSGALPTIGQTATIVLDDPGDSMGVPSNSILAISTISIPNGFLLQNFGLAAPGAAGELLIGGLEVVQAGPQWNGTPVSVAAQIPNDLGLVGRTFFAQGLLIDPSARFGLTDAVELFVGQ